MMQHTGIKLFAWALLVIVLFSQIPVSYAKGNGMHPEPNLSLTTGFQEAKNTELSKKIHSQITQKNTNDWKVDPRILASKDDTIEVLIETTDGYNNADLKYVQKNRMQEFILGKFVYMKIPKSEINKLEKINSVKKIQADKEYKPLLDVAVPLINANAFSTNNLNGSGIKVCVLDTGVNKTHPALISRVMAEKDFVITDSDGDNPADFQGHGTHVAGIVASTDSTYRGVAFGSSILNAKVFSSTSGSASTSDIISGIDWCISQGANILTLSLGGQDEQNDGSDALSQYVDLAVDQGTVVTIAAGNSGPSGNTDCRTSKDPTGAAYSICAPGLSHKGITVGSTQTSKHNTNDGLSGFSGRGPTSDLRIKPDVTAPGEWITSANAGYQSGALWTDKRGTSMAAPIVAGLSALILQARNMSPEEVKALLMNTAVDLGSPGKDNSYGAGRVNASRVFDEINNTARNAIDNTGYKIHNIFVPSGSKEIRATLYWPETYSSHNDMDLYLLDPAGNISASSLSADNTDEMIKLSNPSPAGNWKLLVDPFSVNGNQVYSLASNFKPSEQMYLGTGNISDKIAYHRINVTDSSKKLIANLDWNFTNANLDIYLYNTSGHLVNQSLAVNTNYEEVSANVPESGMWLVRIVPFNLGTHTEISYSLTSTSAVSLKILDDTAPNVTLIEPTNKTYNTRTVNLAFQVIDNLDNVVDCYRTLDNTTDFPYSVQTDHLSAHNFSVSDGTHGISVTCVDTANNSGDSPLIYFTVDTTAPGVTPMLPATGANLSTANVTFNFTATDALSNMSCNLSINGAANRTFSAITNGSNAVYATSNFHDGNYNWAVSCQDDAGNVNDSVVTWNFTVDTTAPTISLNLPSNNFNTATTNLTFNWTATDMLSVPLICNLTMDGAVNKPYLPVENGTPYSTTAITSGFTDGPHAWSVSCQDNLGNTNNTVPAWNFTVDTILPSISDVQITPKSAKPSSNVTLIATIYDFSSVNSAYLVVYNSSWTEVIPRQNLKKSGRAWVLTFNISDSSAGIYYFNITATDANNNATVLVGNLSVDGTVGATGIFTNTSVSAPDNQTTINAIQDTNVSLQIKTNQSVSTAVVAISSYAENPETANTGVPALNKYLDITTSSDMANALSWAIIKVYYDDSDIPLGHDENNLRIYYFNGTSRSWTEYDGALMGGVNTIENYVWANTTHFSIYGVFIKPTCNDGIQNQGERGTDCGGSCSACYSPPSSPPVVSSGSGSGGGSGSGSGFNYLPEYGKLSILGYPARMNAEQGRSVSYAFTIKNTGNATLNGVTIAIGGMDPGWFSIEPEKAGELKADAEQIFILRVRPPIDAVPQTYRLTLSATSDEGRSVNAVSSFVLDVTGKVKTEPAPIVTVEPERAVQAAGLTPAMTVVTTTAELPMDLTPTGKGIAFSLYGGSSLLLLGTARRRRRMHKLHEAHLTARSHHPKKRQENPGA